MNFLKRDLIIREPLLFTFLVLITVVFSTLTHSYTHAYDHRPEKLGKEWDARGNQELANNRPAAAVENFRTALFYAPKNWDYQLHLAEALTKANQTKQAFDYYLSLWQTTPRNGALNLQLARLTARNGDPPEAERYFNGAIFGDWPEHSEELRRQASFELIDFYLQHGDTGQAESRLLIVSANLPEDSALHTRVGDLYSRIGDEKRALKHYRQAVDISPDYLPAIRGAGVTSFRMGDYPAADTYLSKVVSQDKSDPEAKKLLEISQSIFGLDLFESGLPQAERARRSLHIFEIVGTRLRSCQSSPSAPASLGLASSLDSWNKRNPNANLRHLMQHPYEIDALFDFSATVEKQLESACGEPSSDDSAVLAIARQRTTEEK